MDEDNFELNLSYTPAQPRRQPPAAAPKPKPSAPAGHAAQAGRPGGAAERGRGSASAGGSEHAVSSDSATLKSGAHQTARAAGTRKEMKKQGSGKPGGAQNRPEGVISSLFSFNPTIPTMPKAKPAESAEVKDVFSATNYADLPIDSHLVEAINTELGITKLTVAQRLAIPHLLQRKDVLIKSPTGTGKTLAYAVPVVQYLLSASPKIQRIDGVIALVLTPTRELALQTQEVLNSLLHSFVWIVTGVVMGGEKKKSEKARLRKGVNVLVGTPGRLLDHLQHTQALNVSNLQWLVLDEADRLTDQGFEKEVSQIVKLVNDQRRPEVTRTNVLLSATLTDSVQRLAEISLRTPVLVDSTAEGVNGEGKGTAKVVESKPEKKSKKAVEAAADEKASAAKKRKATSAEEEEEEESEEDDDESKSSDHEDKAKEQFSTSARLTQFFAIVPAKLRLVSLFAFLQAECCHSEGKAIVFFSTRDAVKFFELLLAGIGKWPDGPLHGLECFFLHGGAAQADRTRTYFGFCKARSGVLFCTDVAARGLDMPMVKWIIQANAPTSVAEYIHRVGRTARMETSGSSLLLLLPSEAEFVSVLTEHGLRVSEKRVDDVLLGLAKAGSRSHDEAAEAATGLQLRLEKLVLQDKPIMAAAKSALQAIIGAYSTYPASLKHIFHVKSLHLGHLAKSFALRDAPGETRGKKNKHSGKDDHGKKRFKGDDDEDRKKKKTLKKAMSDEFSAGGGDTLAKRSKKK